MHGQFITKITFKMNLLQQIDNFSQTILLIQ